jgi:hypothetical protein
MCSLLLTAHSSRRLLRARRPTLATLNTKDSAMNDWDRDNLNFLLFTKGEDFEAWYAQADADDLLYARELLDFHAQELKEEAEALRIEAEMAAMSEYHDALRVIAKVVDKK